MVGFREGVRVDGLVVGVTDGILDGNKLDTAEGFTVGAVEGAWDGVVDGSAVGFSVGSTEGAKEGSRWCSGGTDSRSIGRRRG